MTPRLFAALLAPVLVAAPALAQESGDASPAAAPAETTTAEAPAAVAGGDSDTSDPTKLASPAAADGSLGVAATPPDAAAFPLHVSGSLSHFLGQGTFISGAAGNPYVATSLSLNPSADFAGFRFGLAQTFDMEWTQSDTAQYQNQIIWSDTGLTLAYTGFGFEDLGVSFLLNGGASLPISLVSRQQGRLTNLMAGGQVTWTYAPWALSLFTGASASYNVIVPSFASRAAIDDVRPYEDRSLGTQTPSGCLRRAAEELDNYACGTIPSGLGYNVRAGGGWSTLEGQLSFGASVALMQQFSSLWGQDDEYTPPNAQTGLQRRDIFTAAGLTASYAPVSWFALTVGSQTFQPLYTSTRDGVRVFPFWDFTSAANNFSTVFLDTTFTY